jgi:hypothetical protein
LDVRRTRSIRAVKGPPKAFHSSPIEGVQGPDIGRVCTFFCNARSQQFFAPRRSVKALTSL